MEDDNEHRGTKRNNGDDDDDDDPSTLWERLQESQRKKMKLLKDETEQLQKEKDVMNSVGAAAATTTSTNDDDIIEINAGGKIIEALRSTLTLVAPDTMFSYMFSGRWEESLKRDRNGRVFIDENSELIEIIVDFFRMKKREDPSKPGPPPTVRDDKKDNFLSLLNYYGLTEFFYPSSLQPSSSSSVLDITNIDVVNSVASYIHVIKSENKIQFSNDSNNIYEYDHVTCQPPLDSSGEGAFWKVTIDHMEHGSCIFLGIRGNLNSKLYSGIDSTSYGVTPSGVWRGGSYANGSDCNWKGFAQGDCIYFKFKSNKLTMYNVRTEMKFEMDIPRARKAYIHFNLYHNIKVALEPLEEERHTYLL